MRDEVADEAAAITRRLQLLRHLHSCTGCFRLERSPGGICTHWKAPPYHGAHPKRTFLLRGYSEGKSARYRLARISTSRSTYRHSAVPRSRRTISSKASACSGAYSNQVRKSNGSPSSRL